LPDVVENFRRSNAIASLLLVQPKASFDMVHVDPDGAISGVTAFGRSDVRINGGFFVMRKAIFDFIQPGEELVREPFGRLIERRALVAYKCPGFWQCMDTFKDKQALEELNQGAAPWKVWRQSNGPGGGTPEA
jgi:glucose-1-phosphate cytidylyltransferase